MRKYGYRVDEVEGSNPDAPHDSPRRLTGLDAFKLHLTLLIGLSLCAAAFFFELGRAEGGNSLSWAYVFEWPLLGIFGIYMWWNFLHGGTNRLRKKRVVKPAVAPEYTGMLAAWQEYQEDLAASQSATSTDGDASGASEDRKQND